MTKNKEELLLTFAKDIVRLNRQRKYWLIFSSVIFIGVILVIVFSTNINNLKSEAIWWGIGAVGLVVSVNWWYWTLTLVRRVLEHQIKMVLLLEEITTDVTGIRLDIRELFQKGLIT